MTVTCLALFPGRGGGQVLPLPPPPTPTPKNNSDVKSSQFISTPHLGSVMGEYWMGGEGGGEVEGVEVGELGKRQMRGLVQNITLNRQGRWHLGDLLPLLLKWLKKR